MWLLHIDVLPNRKYRTCFAIHYPPTIHSLSTHYPLIILSLFTHYSLTILFLPTQSPLDKNILSSLHPPCSDPLLFRHCLFGIPAGVRRAFKDGRVILQSGRYRQKEYPQRLRGSGCARQAIGLFCYSIPLLASQGRCCCRSPWRPRRWSLPTKDR